MPSIPIIMPQLGESIAEATILSLLVKQGDQVRADQDIIEVETNKATMFVTAPCPGKVDKLEVVLNESYAVGAVLGYILTTQEDANRLGLERAGGSGDETGRTETGTPNVLTPDSGRKTVTPTLHGLPVPVNASGASYMSPRLRARMIELGLQAADMAGVAGSGGAGRVTVEDFERFIKQLDNQKQTQASTMRVAVADAMRRSWARPLATVALPVSFDPLLDHRRKAPIKPGPALYALRALALALAENSAPAGRLIGNRIVHPTSIDVGFAVEAEDGVLVPVMRNAHRQPLMSMVQRYNELIELAHQRRLPADATGGSIATVTNFGTFGLTWATPIPLPEQTLVLGMGAARRVPSWDETKGQFVPVMEANVTLSFDHRVLDGGAAGRLLARISQLLSHPESL